MYIKESSLNVQKELTDERDQFLSYLIFLENIDQFRLGSISQRE